MVCVRVCVLALTKLGSLVLRERLRALREGDLMQWRLRHKRRRLEISEHPHTIGLKRDRIPQSDRDAALLRFCHRLCGRPRRGSTLLSVPYVPSVLGCNLLHERKPAIVDGTNEEAA